MLTHTIRLLVVLPFVVTSAFAAVIQGTVQDTAGQPIAGVSTVAAYDGKWNSTDQVPERAVDDGDSSRFGAIDRRMAERLTVTPLPAIGRGAAITRSRRPTRMSSDAA